MLFVESLVRSLFEVKFTNALLVENLSVSERPDSVYFHTLNAVRSFAR